MANRKYLSVMVATDKIEHTLLTRTCPTHIDIPFVVYLYNRKTGMVVADAICTDIEDVSDTEYIIKRTGMSESKIMRYLNGCDGYLWRLGRVHMYPSPMGIEFYGLNKPPKKKWRYVE